MPSRSCRAAVASINGADFHLPAQTFGCVPLVVFEFRVQTHRCTLCRVPFWEGASPSIVRRFARPKVPLVIGELRASLVPKITIQKPTRYVERTSGPPLGGEQLARFQQRNEAPCPPVHGLTSRPSPSLRVCCGNAFDKLSEPFRKPRRLAWKEVVRQQVSELVGQHLRQPIHRFCREENGRLMVVFGPKVDASYIRAEQVRQIAASWEHHRSNPARRLKRGIHQGAENSSVQLLERGDQLCGVGLLIGEDLEMLAPVFAPGALAG